MALTALLGSCRNDWTIKDMPPVPEKADGAGYVAGFENSDAALVIPVEAAAAGYCRIAVRGRATEDGTPGTGSVSCGASAAQISFPRAAVWQDCEVTLELVAGVNYVEISRAGGNGLFHVDYIEMR